MYYIMLVYILYWLLLFYVTCFDLKKLIYIFPNKNWPLTERERGNLKSFLTISKIVWVYKILSLHQFGRNEKRQHRSVSKRCFTNYGSGNSYTDWYSVRCGGITSIDRWLGDQWRVVFVWVCKRDRFKDMSGTYCSRGYWRSWSYEPTFIGRD